MTIFITHYITDPANVQAAVNIAQQVATDYNILSLLLASESVNNALQKQLPTGFEVVSDIHATVPTLLQNNFNFIMADSYLELKIEEIAVCQVDYKQQKVYFLGTNYFLNKQADLNAFIVQVVKSRSKITYGLVYNDHPFVFSAERDPKNFACIKSSINPCLYDNMPRLFVSWNWGSSTAMCKLWNRYTQRILLTDHQAQSNLSVVVNHSSENIPLTKLIYFCMEPQGEKLYQQYIDKLKGALFVGTHKHHLNNAEWHLSWKAADFKIRSITKTEDKSLSVVVSSKNFDPGHKYRLALIDALDKHPSLPFKLDIYGFCRNLNFRNYRGELPDHAKDDAIFPYKYHLNVENQYIDNYISEKLVDGVLGECLTFYKGAPNVTDFYDKDGMVLLSGNIEEDIRLIIDTISNNAYNKHKAGIMRNKQRVLDQYVLEPRVLSIIQMTYTKCYCLHSNVKDNLIEQGFKNITLLNEDIDLARLVQESLQSFVPVLILTQDVVPALLFDKLCFAYSATPYAHAYTIGTLDEKNINACFMPSGVEIMYVNAQKQKPIFESLKVKML